MPTGYTADVVDGKVTDFRVFAMTCARAFGALIDMRDDPLDTPIPETFEEHSYYRENLDRDRAHLQKVLKMTADEATTEAKKAYDASLKSRTDYLVRNAKETARIDAMLKRVEAWTPPTADHTEMKTFMREQLIISRPGEYIPAIPELLDGKTWRQQKAGALTDSIAYYERKLKKEQERAATRTAWVRDLRTSLA